MQLTRTERWILSNQYRILEALYPKEAADLSIAREALESGFELEYEHLCEHVYSDDNVLTVDKCKEVIDTMAMFDALKRSYDALADKSGIEEWRVKFAGFDGNNETMHMAYARYFCTSGIPRFQDLDRGDNFNSHMPTLARYRAMLQQWRECGKNHELSKDQIIKIVMGR